MPSDHTIGQCSLTTTLEAELFETKLGWFGILGRDGILLRVSIGDRGPADALSHLLNAEGLGPHDADVTDWNPDLRDRLIAYSAGEPVDFDDLHLSWPHPLTAFRERVLNVTRQIPRGQTATYAQVAARAGSPGAARAVGTVMSSNRFPIVIPCHRVVGSGGGLGGFTSPQGTDLKWKMLQLEADGNARRRR